MLKYKIVAFMFNLIIRTKKIKTLKPKMENTRRQFLQKISSQSEITDYDLRL